MMEKRKVCVVVPTYNNGKTIAAVVRRIAVFTEHIIIVIDGCTDDTREQLQQLSDLSSTILRISPCLWRRWSLILVL